MAFMGIVLVGVLFYILIGVLIVTAIVALVLFIVGLVFCLLYGKEWKEKKALGQSAGWKKPFSIVALSVGSVLLIALIALVLVVIL